MTSHHAVDAVTSDNATLDDVTLQAEGCGVEINTSAKSGEVLWSVRDVKSSLCSLHLQVSPHFYLQARTHLKGDKTCWELTKYVQVYFVKQIAVGFSARTFEAIDVLDETILNHGGLQRLGAMTCERSPMFQLMFSPHNEMYLFMVVPSDISIHFTTSRQFLKNVLPVVMVSGAQGYVTSPGYDGLTCSAALVDATHTLTVPAAYEAVMISFARLTLIHVKTGSCEEVSLDLSYVFHNGVRNKTRLCLSQPRRPEVIHNIYNLSLSFHVGDLRHYCRTLGFKMHFSFHGKSALPVKTNDSFFNCQVDFYPNFRRHLHCNNRIECEDGRDETWRCPFSSDACKGKLASGTKCFFTVFTEDSRNVDEEQSHTLINRLSRQCQTEGGGLAVIQSRTEQDDVYRLLAFHDHCGKYLTGLVYRQKGMPTMYSQMWTGVDKSIVYTIFSFIVYRGRLPRLSYSATTETPCMVIQPQYLFDTTSNQLFDQYRDNPYLDSEFLSICGAVCQSFAVPNTENKRVYLNNTSMQNLTSHAALAVPTSSQGTLVLIVCPKGHLTHLFLTCYTNNACDVEQPVDKCYFPKSVVTSSLKFYSGVSDVSQTAHDKHTSATTLQDVNSWREKVPDHAFVLMFVCNDGAGSVHYSKVCDNSNDCKDWSDETFCSYTPCQQFTCSNGQCVPFVAVCDSVPDCLEDNLDEIWCGESSDVSIRQDIELPDPSLIDYDGRGYFTHTVDNATLPCPLTHYRCPGPPHHCLPVYTRCNGFYDCTGREDENQCDDQQCPGYYRCHNSSVCLHPDHLCDGWPQCPHGDDELMCKEKLCPAGCLCQGLAFVCVHPFDVQHFPHIKYLDASDSHLPLADLRSNHDLVYLSLRRCGLQYVSALTFPNLRYFDLSHNQLLNVSMNVFVGLGNLQQLSLSYNPLHTVYSQQTMQKQNTLIIVDLTFTDLTSFNTEPFSDFLSLQRMNLSQAGVDTILPRGFQHVPSLIELDLSGCPVENFPPDLFQGLSRLRKIRADNFKLCCFRILPANFDNNFCLAPQDEISSCEDLVRSQTYRILLWLMSFLSVFGNGFCLAFRLLLRQKSIKGTFNVFVNSLSVADFIMGVYLAMIGIADLSYRGMYLHHDVTWTRSASCRAAGFLSLLSKQVSAFTVALITLDRFIVLSFPFSSVRFGRRSATVAVTSSWIAGFILAVFPLLPVTAHWRFYSQTGICIPLPITRSDFAGRSYSFAVVVVTNFVLFLLIAGGQAAIYKSVRQNCMDWDTTSESNVQDATARTKVKDATVARRLITVAVTDFLCWFPIGLCGILSSVGIPIPGEVNVAAAILILPLNSALNPFLYTLNVAIEMRLRKTRDRLRETLLSNLNKE